MQDTLDHFQEEDRPHMTAVLQDMAFILSVTKPSQTRSGLVKVQTSLRKKMRLPPCTLIESHFSARDDSVSGSPLGSPRSLRSESGQMSETTSLSSYGSTAPKSMDANQWIMTHWQPRLAHLQRGMALLQQATCFAKYGCGLKPSLHQHTVISAALKRRCGKVKMSPDRNGVRPSGQGPKRHGPGR